MTFSLQNPAENRWWVLGVLLMVLLSLVGYVWFLHRQRRRFLETMRRLPVDGRHAWKRDPLRDRQEQAVDNRPNEATNRSAGITPAGTLGGVPHYVTVSYFSRCFRTMFGVSPTQFSDSRY